MQPPPTNGHRSGASTKCVAANVRKLVRYRSALRIALAQETSGSSRFLVLFEISLLLHIQSQARTSRQEGGNLPRFLGQQFVVDKGVQEGAIKAQQNLCSHGRRPSISFWTASIDMPISGVSMKDRALSSLRVGDFTDCAAKPRLPTLLVPLS